MVFTPGHQSFILSRMFLRAFLLGLFLVVAARADEVALVRIGEDWHYFKGTTEPSTPIEAWRQLAFDDSNWLVGPSGFRSADGGYDDATILGDMSFRYSSVFFRKKFIVADPAAIKWLVLRLDYDDGFVAYLNGQEIVRKNLAGNPGSPVAFNTAASMSHARGSAEDIDITVFIPLLASGDNILAIQGHNLDIDDFSFAMTTELLANFNRGPFIQNSSTNSTQVIWRTPVASDSMIEYGLTPAVGEIRAVGDPVTEHAVTLTNLAPGTQYYYRVRSSAAGQNAVSPVASFRTLKMRGDLTFAVFGDSGVGGVPQFQIANLIKESAPDLVLHVGDIIYPGFTTGYVDLRCLSVYRPHMRSTPYYFVFGNHDLYSDPGPNGDRPFLEAFYLPTNSATGTKHFYSFDHGDAHFTVLFMPYLIQFAQYPQYRMEIGSTQYNWMTNDLAQSTKLWKFLFCHVPPRTSGPHRFDNTDPNGIYDRLEIQQWLFPPAKQYGVQMIFSGHDHDFERFVPTNGIHTIVTGGGGVFLYFLTERDAGSAQYWSRHNFTKVTITGDSLFLQAIDNNGQIFDTMSLQRALPTPRIYNASWHTPALDATLADDGDGNLNGQTFDFIGTPIPTLPGQFSNLGRVYVNNDATNFYVGFEQSMIYGDNNIFLFIESPRKAGVTNMAGLGNGLVDPTGQGVDGLDFLENLSFTNFSPIMGCILGDEFGDYTTNNFARPGLALNIGQGVFYLDKSLTAVPGARLQQFNRSPQAGPEFGEQNADFIEVSIPASALGNPQPGDTLKIGAVVAGPGFNVGEQTRELDSSFLGDFLSGSGQTNVVLQGVRVQLAAQPPSVIHLSAAALAANRYRLTWTASAGAKYQLESAESTPAGFTPVGDPAFPRTATSTIETYDVDLSSETDRPRARYYRVRLIP
ncbi:MAG: hypothetical protein DME26_04635 [Verrucomicrobia bacterium]|nr:MAG: hypothetical protein DME26_04635 [Verrucomicrobiota bacterium]